MKLVALIIIACLPVLGQEPKGTDPGIITGPPVTYSPTECCVPASRTATVVGDVYTQPSFFGMRQSFKAPPNRTRWLPMLLVDAGGAAAMVVACRNPRSGESWGSEVPAVIATDAMGWLGGRYFMPAFAEGPGGWQMIRYSISARK